MIKKIEVRIDIDGDKKSVEGEDIDTVLAEVDAYLASYRGSLKGGSWFSHSKG